ncbi:hypothetical protein BDK88_1656 [Natrinema hispanicum]|uniref:Uncharacterized protein n=1 Tax=Natrinema hispanicum TaxID=392421 RepID=A0A482YAU3_9EURY|nr:hypothetical protein [Natrinema hispanicum]RZV10488.1 hypothetical protein BDK88_1656 [Natrinema hispanicum]
MSDELLNVHEEVKETFRDRIQDNDSISDPVTDSIISLTDEEMTDSGAIQSVVEEALADEDS